MIKIVFSGPYWKDNFDKIKYLMPKFNLKSKSNEARRTILVDGDNKLACDALVNSVCVGGIEETEVTTEEVNQ